MLSLFSFHKHTSSSSLQRYLKHVKWDHRHYSSEKLEGKLVCAMYKYLLGKLTDIHFLLELSEEIREKQGKKMHPNLATITTILHQLSQKLQKKEIDPSNTKMLYVIIDKTQQIATGKSFLS